MTRAQRDAYTRLVQLRGRSTADNPPNRFETTEYVPDPDAYDPDEPGPRTRLLPDASRSIVATNDSPDIPFDASINPYRGCEHGCVYCYARPTHEYLGMSAGLDFETRILVKHEAPALLRRTLASPRWRPRTVMLSGVTDPYQPAEAKLRLTRGVLEVLAEARNPVGVITKNFRVTRDIDLLRELARHDAVRVMLSITTLDRELQRLMEPRTSVPARRLAAVRALSEAGIPVGVMVAPVIPGLTDHELPRILEAGAAAGARAAGYVALRLPLAVAPLFSDWLERHFPDRKERVLNRVREMRGGALYDSGFGTRMRGEGVYAEHLQALFAAGVRRAGLGRRFPPPSAAAFRRPEPPPERPLGRERGRRRMGGPDAAQLGLFGSGGRS